MPVAADTPGPLGGLLRRPDVCRKRGRVDQRSWLTHLSQWQCGGLLRPRQPAKMLAQG